MPKKILSQYPNNQLETDFFKPPSMAVMFAIESYQGRGHPEIRVDSTTSFTIYYSPENIPLLGPTFQSHRANGIGLTICSTDNGETFSPQDDNNPFQLTFYVDRIKDVTYLQIYSQVSLEFGVEIYFRHHVDDEPNESSIDDTSDEYSDEETA